jgi:hypothetical protein
MLQLGHSTSANAGKALPTSWTNHTVRWHHAHYQQQCTPVSLHTVANSPVDTVPSDCIANHSSAASTHARAVYITYVYTSLEHISAVQNINCQVLGYLLVAARCFTTQTHCKPSQDPPP